jgi:hypothetical protein
LQAAREEVLNLNLVTMTRLPQMLGILYSAVTTDIPVRDVPALANLGRQIQGGRIVSRQIDDTMINDVNRDGTVLVPERERVRVVVQELFYNPAQRVDMARIEVLNGTTTEGIASNARTSLLAAGWNPTRVDTADRSNYARSVIIDRTGRAGVAARLAQALRLPATAITTGDSRPSDAEITVILGADFQRP